MRGPRKGDVASECAKLAVPTPMGSGTKGSQAHPPKGRAWMKRGAVKKPPINWVPHPGADRPASAKARICLALQSWRRRRTYGQSPIKSAAP